MLGLTLFYHIWKDIQIEDRKKNMEKIAMWSEGVWPARFTGSASAQSA